MFIHAATLSSSYVRPSTLHFTGYDPQIDAKIRETETLAFEQLLETEVELARKFIDVCIKMGEKGFVVLDVDETVLDNRGYYRDPGETYYKHPHKNFYETWDAWVAKGEAPALGVTRKLIEWFNREEIPYCFVTGRISKQKDVTWANLKAQGLVGQSCRGVYTKPDEWWVGTTTTHKKATVAKLEKEWNIPALASIGDLAADMMLMNPARNFKLSSSRFYPTRQ